MQSGEDYLSMQSRILSVGRLVPRKGHAFLIDAVKLLVDRGRNIKLVIVGYGPLKNELMAKGRSIDLEIKEAISEEELNEEYKKADVFVLPSITDNQGEKEGLGLVALEAIYFGVPVVAFDNGGIGEVIIDGKTGLLIPEKDVAGLAKAIEKMLDDKELRARLIKEATEFASRTFSAEVLARQQAELYKEILENEVVFC